MRDTTHAQRDEALLICTLGVFACQGEVDRENGECFDETDNMCDKICCCFGGVPFILHVLSVWTIVCFVKDRWNRCRGLTPRLSRCRKRERRRSGRWRQSAAGGL